jgi:TatD DNase family protein
MGIIDSHNHIHFREFNKDRQAVMDRAASAGIRTMLAVGIDPKDCARAVQTACTYPGVYVAVGFHPQNGGKHTREDVFALSSLHADKVVAVGETGFDLYRTPHSAEDQEDLFRAHIELAQHMRLPSSYMTGRLTGRPCMYSTIRVRGASAGCSIASRETPTLLGPLCVRGSSFPYPVS